VVGGLLWVGSALELGVWGLMWGGLRFLGGGLCGVCGLGVGGVPNKKTVETTQNSSYRLHQRAIRSALSVRATVPHVFRLLSSLWGGGEAAAATHVHSRRPLRLATEEYL